MPKGAAAGIWQPAGARADEKKTGYLRNTGTETVQVVTVPGDEIEHRPKRGLVIGHTAVITDALDDPVGDRFAAFGMDQLVFQRGRSGVQDQNGAGHHSPCAWIAVIATV